eukprot:Sdes_comp20494_c0_seq3m14930
MKEPLKEPVGDLVVSPDVPDRPFVCGSGKLFVPPLQSHKFISWGHADCSIRVHMSDTAKIISIHEGMHLGQIASVVFADRSTLVTGGEDSVVSVWKVPNAAHKEVRFILKESLYGHRYPVGALCASRPFSIVVSGSTDGSCIIWDLNSLKYVRDCDRKMNSAILHIVVNNLSGNILVATQYCLSLFTVNGISLAFLNLWDLNVAELMMTVTPAPPTFSISPIRACALTEGPEWDDGNLIITAHDDGLLHFWSLSRDSTRGEISHEDPTGAACSPIHQPLDQLPNCIQFVAQKTIPEFLATPGADNGKPCITHLVSSIPHNRIYAGDNYGRVFMLQ